MHSHVAILLLVGVSLALANPAPMITAAPGHAFKPRQVTATASSTPISELDPCSTSFDAFLSSRPTQGPAIDEYLRSNSPTEISRPSRTDPSGIESECSQRFDWRATFVPPASISSEYTSFLNAWTSWVVTAQPEATSLASACAGAGGLAENALLLVMTDIEDCKTALSVFHGLINAAELTSTDSPQPTQGDSGEDGNEALTTDTSTGAAAGPRETGYVAAAMAAAGVVGMMGLA
ncbi:hypothetical protein MMYC01_202636 [Madurella mycetomatis]|uniref:Infection structure specific protein n=1 Tax=Madurella mycetomatis TaxID=100816 RepID=A0A175WCC5_9PEZI|nr:hypothetical protein MMYC01_202636 [Madurella mycetomatis]